MAEPMGFFTDTTVCIGCKACEVACKEWNQLPAANGGRPLLSGDSLRQHAAARRHPLAALEHGFHRPAGPGYRLGVRVEPKRRRGLLGWRR
jgi:ferredoxin